MSGFLSITEVADQLGVSHQTIRKLISSGDLVAYRVGGSWRIDPKDLADYLERVKSGGRNKGD